MPPTPRRRSRSSILRRRQDERQVVVRPSCPSEWRGAGACRWRRWRAAGAATRRSRRGASSLEASERSGGKAVDGGLSRSESDGDRDLERSAAKGNGKSEAFERGTNGGAGRDCNLEGLDGDAAAKESSVFLKESNLEEVLDGDGVTGEPNGATKPSNLPGFQCNGAAEESNSAAKDCKSEGFSTGGDAVTSCRNGRKALAPWRFQIGYKREWSQGFTPGNASDDCPATLTSKFRDASRKCGPATGRNRSRVRVSAARSKPSVKVQRGAASIAKKRKIDKDDQHQAMPRTSISRETVMTSLREFRIIYRKLLEEEKNNCTKQENGLRPDLAAFKIFRERLCVEYDDRRYVGSVPGVQIGDVFDFSTELCVVGLHRSQLLGVDHIKEDGTCLAVSIVSYAQPSALNNNMDFLLHFGSMAATSDQKMEGTDLALKQSMDTSIPVRVIHGFVIGLGGNYQPDGLTNYVYGGLYLVEKFCREEVKEQQYIHTFYLRRMPGQPHIDIQELTKTRNLKPFDGAFILDISGGLEKVPISAINTISNEYPVPFCYISQIQYPPKHQPDPLSGCDCVDGCSNSRKCACAVKNGGDIPFSDNGGIIDEKPLVYECGPSCKCPPTCHNRVSQHGIKFRLQVFKTKSMGWGVRSLDFIPAGSFVCEYVGELLENEEAQERKNDEYFFEIGNNYYDISRWDVLSKTIPSLQNGPRDDEKIGFVLDALNWGNLARLINHSCTPNLFAQSVLYDHDNKSMPHIMFFACENIPPLQQLSYDYNYKIDEVCDTEGNIKMKQCFCGSIECNGWLY